MIKFVNDIRTSAWDKEYEEINIQSINESTFYNKIGYEVLNDRDDLRIYGDIERYFSSKKELLEKAKAFEKKYSKDWYLSKCNRKLSEKKYKMSYHIVHKKYYSKGTSSVLSFMKSSKILGEGFDTSVYSKNQLMRAGGSKGGQVFKGVNYNNIKDLIIQYIPENSEKVENPSTTKGRVDLSIYLSEEKNVEEIVDLIGIIDPERIKDRKIWRDFTWSCAHAESIQREEKDKNRIYDSWVSKCRESPGYNARENNLVYSQFNLSKGITYATIYYLANLSNQVRFLEIKNKYKEEKGSLEDLRGEFMDKNKTFTFIDFLNKWVHSYKVIRESDISDFKDDLVRTLGFTQGIKKTIISKENKLNFNGREIIVYKINNYTNSSLVERVNLQKGKKVVKKKLRTFIEEEMGRDLRYKGIHFMPSNKKNTEYFNEFSGFYGNIEGSYNTNSLEVKNWLYHIREVMCNGNKKTSKWFLDILRRIASEPHRKTGVCPIFTGLSGSGKNIFLKFFKEFVIGEEYATEIGSFEKVTGKFNNILYSKVVVILNEMETIYEKKRKAFETFKTLVTEKTLNIERKGLESFTAPNYITFIGTTNNDIPIRISNRERRYLLIKTSNDKVKDYDYFENLAKGLNKKTGIEFFHYLLKTYDPSINLEATRSLNKETREAKDHSMSSFHTFLTEIYTKFKDIRTDIIVRGLREQIEDGSGKKIFTVDELKKLKIRILGNKGISYNALMKKAKNKFLIYKKTNRKTYYILDTWAIEEEFKQKDLEFSSLGLADEDSPIF